MKVWLRTGISAPVAPQASLLELTFRSVLSLCSCASRSRACRLFSIRWYCFAFTSKGSISLTPTWPVEWSRLSLLRDLCERESSLLAEGACRDCRWRGFELIGLAGTAFAEDVCSKCFASEAAHCCVWSVGAILRPPDPGCTWPTSAVCDNASLCIRAVEVL